MPKSPYHSLIYASFQERATFISNGHTARLAVKHGDRTRCPRSAAWWPPTRGGTRPRTPGRAPSSSTWTRTAWCARWPTSCSGRSPCRACSCRTASATATAAATACSRGSPRWHSATACTWRATTATWWSTSCGGPRGPVPRGPPRAGVRVRAGAQDPADGGAGAPEGGPRGARHGPVQLDLQQERRGGLSLSSGNNLRRFVGRVLYPCFLLSFT